MVTMKLLALLILLAHDGPHTEGVNVIPPSYLSVQGHQYCVKNEFSNPELHKSVCLLKVQPVACLARAWEELTELVQNGELEQCGNYDKLIVRLMTKNNIPYKYSIC